MGDYDGWMEPVRIANPAAGTGASRRIPGETFERLESIRFQLVASAAVANRFASIDFLDGDSNTQVRIQSTTAITAGQTFRLTFARGIGVAQSGGTNEQLMPLPHTIFPPGWKFQVTIGNIDVADQISNIFAVVCRYPSDLWSPSRGATPYQE